MPALKVGDVRVGRVTKVTSGLIQVTVDDVRGIIPRQLNSTAKVGDRLKIRILELKNDGGFIATRLDEA